MLQETVDGWAGYRIPQEKYPLLRALISRLMCLFASKGRELLTDDTCNLDRILMAIVEIWKAFLH